MPVLKCHQLKIYAISEKLLHRIIFLNSLQLSEIKKIARLEGFTSMYENAKALEQKGIINDSSIIQEIFT